MKKGFSVIIVLALFAASCTKDVRGPGNPPSDNSGLDDHRHGGDGGGGGGIAVSSVPGAVMMSFTSQFPAATNIEWKKLSDGTYKVQFMNAGTRWEAVYTPAGARIKLERAS